MRDTNGNAYADAHTYDKSDGYSNGNTYSYAHAYDYSFTYSQSNTAASSHAAAAAKSIVIKAMMVAK